MKLAKEITLVSLFTALLIGGQLVLSQVAGVEIVTVLFLSFAYYFGAKRGLIVATLFSIFRCFIFGFFPTALILYLVYYNLVALVFGMLGFFFHRAMNNKIHIILLFCSLIMTACFTLLDDLITPLFYGFSREVMLGYFYASLPVMLTQLISTIITVALLLRPLYKVYNITQKNQLVNIS